METPLPPQLIPNPPIPPTLKQPIDGSPRAVSNDTTDQLPAVPNAKLRLMCSFGGHIMPRPHDKSLTYSGGETRLVVVDRRASLTSLRSRLSTMLLNGRSFTLKYQLPSEDLDSLVTITSEEDLENMIEEYDRATSTRIRLFLFANKLETAATMGSLLEGAKSDTWFVDALNQSGLLPRGLSDSAAVNNTLVNLDDGETLEINNNNNNVVGGGLESNNNNNKISHQEMQMSSMPDSPMMDSSIGSSSSSPNLPPIRVRVNEEQRIDEQFAQMSFANVNTQSQRQFDDGVGMMASNRPMLIPVMTDASSMVYTNNNAASDGVGNGQVLQEDDRGDSGVTTGYRKPPLPMQPVAIPPRGVGGYGLASPDSVTSDTSISSASSFSKPMYYQDQSQSLPRGPVTQPETTSVQTSHGLPQTETTSAQTTSPHVLSQPGTYTPMDQQHQPPPQQPFLHQGVQYIPHPSQYIPVYSHQQQNYPVYMMSVPQSQQYVPAGTPPLYPNSKVATNQRLEGTQNIYRAPVSQTPLQGIQLQQQHQYMGYTGIPQHTTNANANANYGSGVPQHATNANYGGGYQYASSPNETMYYQTQPPTPNTAIPLASPYQSMTPAAAAAALADMSKQMALDGGKQQQHMATVSQPQPQ